MEDLTAWLPALASLVGSLAGVLASNKLTQYRILQYNNVFDKDERAPGVFALTE